MFYYKFNISDYNAHTGHLEPLEDLAYRRMLDWLYLHEKPLPKSVDEIARFICMRPHCECIANVLHEFFIEDEDGYFNERCNKELQEYSDKCKTNKKAADARWKKEKAKKRNKINKLDDDANALQVDSERNAKQETLNIKQEPITIKEKKPSQSEIDIDDIFKFWKLTLNKTETAKLTKERKKKILDRLNENYTVEEIKRAITGCTQSAYHMGKNENGKIYDSLELILRSGENLEKFIGYNTTILQVNNNATNQSNANGKQTNGIRRTRTPTTTARIWDNQES